MLTTVVHKLGNARDTGLDLGRPTRKRVRHAEEEEAIEGVETSIKKPYSSEGLEGLVILHAKWRLRRQGEANTDASDTPVGGVHTADMCASLEESFMHWDKLDSPNQMGTPRPAVVPALPPPTGGACVGYTPVATNESMCSAGMVVGRRVNDDTNVVETMICPDFPRKKDACILVPEPTTVCAVDLVFLQKQHFHVCWMSQKIIAGNQKTLKPERARAGQVGRTGDAAVDTLRCWPLGTWKATKKRGRDCLDLVVGIGVTSLEDFKAKHRVGWHVSGCKVPGVANFAEQLG